MIVCKEQQNTTPNYCEENPTLEASLALRCLNKPFGVVENILLLDELFWSVHNTTIQPEEPPLTALPLEHVTEKGNTSKFISHYMVNAEMLAKKHSSVFSSVNMYIFKMQDIRASNTQTNTTVMQKYIEINSIIRPPHQLVQTSHPTLTLSFHVINGAPPTIITF